MGPENQCPENCGCKVRIDGTREIADAAMSCAKGAHKKMDDLKNLLIANLVATIFLILGVLGTAIVWIARGASGS